MKRYAIFVLPALLLAALFLASCGGTSSAQEESEGEMSGMDHGSMEMGSGASAPPELIVDGEYSDERFVDMMAAHHQMAIDMATVAQEYAELPEISRLADEIISSQQGEIDEFSGIKEAEFGSSELPTAMSPEEPSMQAMTMPDELAGQEPFDRAFIDSMIPHHASAIEMASTALMRSDNAEIKRLSRDIVDAQSREIGDMIELRRQYYPEG